MSTTSTKQQQSSSNRNHQNHSSSSVSSNSLPSSTSNHNSSSNVNHNDKLDLPTSLADIDHPLFHLATMDKLKQFLPKKLVDLGDRVTNTALSLVGRSTVATGALQQSRLLMLTFLASIMNFVPKAPVKLLDDFTSGGIDLVQNQFQDYSGHFALVTDSSKNIIENGRDQLIQWLPILLGLLQQLLSPESWYSILDKVYSFVEYLMDRWMPLPGPQPTIPTPSSTNIAVRILHRSQLFIGKVHCHLMNFVLERRQWLIGLKDNFYPFARPVPSANTTPAAAETTVNKSPEKVQETSKQNGEASPAKTNGNSAQAVAAITVPQSAVNTAKIEKVLGTIPTVASVPAPSALPATIGTKQPVIDITFQQQVFAAVDQIVSNGNSNNNNESFNPETNESDKPTTTKTNPTTIKTKEQQPQEPQKQTPEVKKSNIETSSKQLEKNSKPTTTNGF